jgi:glycosyltransferase involved in cell wall biosynthesis
MHEYQLSIVIPTYNRENFLSSTLENLINQVINGDLSKEICITVIDNYSTDGSSNICEQYSQYEFFTYIKNESNIGATLNITKAAKLGKGIYSWVLFDDDWITEKSLLNIINYIKETEVDSYFLNGGWFIEDHMNPTEDNLFIINENKTASQLSKFEHVPAISLGKGCPSFVILKTSILADADWDKYNNFKCFYAQIGIVYEYFNDKSSALISKPTVLYHFGGWRDDSGDNFGGVTHNFETFINLMRMFNYLVENKYVSIKQLNNETFGCYMKTTPIKKYVSQMSAYLDFTLKSAILNQSGLSIDQFNQINSVKHLFSDLHTIEKLRALQNLGLSLTLAKEAVANIS